MEKRKKKYAHVVAATNEKLTRRVRSKHRACNSLFKEHLDDNYAAIWCASLSQSKKKKEDRQKKARDKTKREKKK